MQTRLTLSRFKGAAEPPLIDETVGQRLLKTAARFPDREALVVRHQDVRWTWREYLERIDRLAAGLLALGIEPGDRVGVWAPNCAEWCLTQFATARIGAILVNVNPAYRVFELEYALNKSGCRAIIAAERFKSSEYLRMLQDLAPELAQCAPGRLRAAKLPALEIVIRMGDGRTAGMFNLDGVCGLGGPAERERLETIGAELSPQDVINIQFTSGTTGAPKAATLTHHNMINNASMSAAILRFTEGDKLCVPVPMYHCFAMVLGTLLCATRGATIVFPGAAFDALETLQAVQDERCTALHGVPTMFIAMLDHPDFAKFDLTALRTGIMAGAPCPIELMREVIDKMHMSEITIGYGMTETGPLSTQTSPDDPIDLRVVADIHGKAAMEQYALQSVQLGKGPGPFQDGLGQLRLVALRPVAPLHAQHRLPDRRGIRCGGHAHQRGAFDALEVIEHGFHLVGEEGSGGSFHPL